MLLYQQTAETADVQRMLLRVSWRSELLLQADAEGVRRGSRWCKGSHYRPKELTEAEVYLTLSSEQHAAWHQEILGFLHLYMFNVAFTLPRGMNR